MVDKKISELPAVIGAILGDEIVPIVQNGSTVRSTVAGLGSAHLHSGIYEALPTKPAIQMSVLTNRADGRYYFNGVHTNQDNVVTYNGKQYAVWTAYDQKAYVAQRDVLGGPWTTFCISDLAGAPMATFTELDLHNTYCIGVDSTGYIHVAGNMHGSLQERYIRSTNPEDITTWTDAAFSASAGVSMSYPRFLNLPDGTLLYHWRRGASGSADTYMERYNTGTQTWAHVGKVLDGLTPEPDQSAYAGKIYVEDDGTANGVIHMFYIWAPAYASLCYARSHDGGGTWKKVDGTALSRPMGPTDAIVYTGAGLINSCPAWVGSDGRPHTVNLVTVGANRQVIHIWWNGSAWQSQVLTKLVESGVSSTGQPISPIIFGDPLGKVYVGYAHRLDGKRGSYLLIDVDSPYVEFPLFDLDTVFLDPTYDVRALKERDELTMLVGQAVLQPATAPGGGYGSYHNDDNWLNQYLAVVTADLRQMAKVHSGATSRPRIKPLGVISAPVDTVVTAGTYAVVPGSQSTMTPPDLRGTAKGAMLLVRLSCRASVSIGGTTLAVRVEERQQGGSSRTFGTMSFTGTSSATKMTPWMPMTTGPIVGGDSELRIQAQATGGGVGTLISAKLEYGVLAGPGTGVSS